ncbi:MAG TPA: type II toxin-antitoxin system RelE/ParE family toxin [Steroidobacteraceae bacterium]|nr:type II toxin-antitoxin system RelE/ParE family toxin [Steroidobacteraceae bacterium]
MREAPAAAAAGPTRVRAVPVGIGSGSGGPEGRTGVRAVGAGVWELRIDVGPGYRAYYMRVGESVYLMLGGGDKSSQAKDVDRVIRMASELKSTARAKKARKSK